MSDTVSHKAITLEKMVSELNKLEKNENLLQGFQTRKETLAALVSETTELVKSRNLLKEGGVFVDTNTINLVPFRTQVNEVIETYTVDPDSILKPHGFKLDQNRKIIEDLKQALEKSWYIFTVPGDRGERLLNVLYRYPPFQKKVDKIRQLRNKLAQKAEQLPKAVEEIEQVKKWQDDLRQTVATLKGEGIDDEVLEFLRELADGVILANLLDNKKVMKWIYDNNLTESFQVTSL